MKTFYKLLRATNLDIDYWSTNQRYINRHTTVLNKKWSNNLEYFVTLQYIKSRIPFKTENPLFKIFIKIREIEEQFDFRQIEHESFQFIVSFCRKYNLNDKIFTDNELLYIVREENFDIFHWSLLDSVAYICLSNYDCQNFINNLIRIRELTQFALYSYEDLEAFGLIVTRNRIKDRLNDAFENKLFYNNEKVF